MSTDKSWTVEIEMPEEPFKAFAWGAWMKARRKVLAFAPSLKGLSHHERGLVRRAALQDPVDARDLIEGDEIIAEELASPALGGTMDPVSKVVHLTLAEFLPTGEGKGPKPSQTDALRLRMALIAVKPPASISPVLLLMAAIELRELADQLEIERAREEAARTPRKPRAQKNAPLISAARDIRRRRPNLSMNGIAKILQERDEWQDLSINAIRKRLAGVL